MTPPTTDDLYLALKARVGEHPDDPVWRACLKAFEDPERSAPTVMVLKTLAHQTLDYLNTIKWLLPSEPFEPLEIIFAIDRLKTMKEHGR